MKSSKYNGSDWLKYFGIDALKMRMISLEQQFAEKLHAYTLPREQKQNSRVKDLVDMLLLKQYRPIDRRRFKDTLQKVYDARGTHALPENLVFPPSEWLPLFAGFVQTAFAIHKDSKSKTGEFFFLKLDG